MNRLIGIAGWARSGKDTAAMELIRNGFQRVAFADQLKAELANCFGVTVQQIEAEKALWRPLLVEYGRTWRRMDPGHWIKLAASGMPDADVAVTDVRYRNEAEWIWQQGGFVIRIHRTGIDAANDEERDSLAELDAASTRQTFTIFNTGTVEELHKKVEGVWRNL